MEEIASFVDSGLSKEVPSRGNGEESGEGQIHRGMSSIFRRLDDALENDGKNKGDVGTLLSFAKEAGDVLAEKAKS